MPPRPDRRTLLAGALAAPWLAWALVRTLGLDHGHPVVAVMAFTPYAAATAWVPVVLALVLRRWRVAALAALGLGALALAVLPRAFGDGRVPATADGPTLRVMSFNAFVGRADMAAVLRLAERERIDVLALVELTPANVRAFDAAGGRERFPSRVVDAGPGAAGSGLFVRVPLPETGRDPASLVRAAQPSGTIAPPGAAPVAVKVVHPRPPISVVSEARWQAAIEALPRPGTEPTGPLRLLLGDFNATLDHRTLRGLLEDGYADAAASTGNGLAPTWPVGRTRPSITIDHVLLDRRLGVRSYAVRTLPGSDHRAVIAELVLPT